MLSPSTERKSNKLRVFTCSLVDWFQFHKCTIKTCKNHSANPMIESGCLAIDRRQPEGVKVITDEELHLFKFYGTKTSTRSVSTKRKIAEQRVKAMLVLHGFVQHIEHKAGVSTETVFVHKELYKLERQYPLKISRLGFRNWMWEYLLDEQEFASFLTKQNGECNRMTIAQILDLTEEEYQNLRTQLTGVIL